MSAIVEKDEAGLDARYAEIAAAQPAQEAAFARFVEETGAARYASEAAAMGLTLDVATGHIGYAADFAVLPLSFDLLYCRHGKTTGNTEPRVYQGFVDEPQNALNATGLRQAEDAADLLDGMGLTPDLIVCSPLARAYKTGEAYFSRHPELASRVEVWDDAAEMRFGGWDNRMVKDLAADNICHLFYLAQNALVKPAEPYVDPSSGAEHAAENFVETLARMRRVLLRVEARVAAGGVGGASGARPLVLMYGHSMAGAALSVLTGNGKAVDGADPAYLGFDGKYIMPNATPTFLLRGGAAPPAAAGVTPVARKAPLPRTVEDKIAHAQALKSEGNDYFKSGNVKKAKTIYSRIFAFTSGLQAGGGDIADWAASSLGVSEETAKEQQRSTSATKEQLAEAEDLRATANLNLAACSLRLEQPQKAMQYCRDALKLRKDNPKALFRMAQAQMRLGLLDEAKESLSEASALAPDDRGIKLEQRKLAQAFKAHRERERACFAKAFSHPKRKIETSEEAAAAEPGDSGA